MDQAYYLINVGVAIDIPRCQAARKCDVGCIAYNDGTLAEMLVVIERVEMVANHHRILNNRAAIGILSEHRIKRRNFPGLNHCVQSKIGRSQVAMKRMAIISPATALFSTAMGASI